MTKRVLHIFLIAALAIVSAGQLHAQKYPERRHIRSGNKLYEQGSYPESEVEFRRALEKAPDTYEADFNLANALYRQERYDEAAQIFQRLAQDSLHTDHAAAAHYNAGNALFKERKLKESLEQYKSSLRRNPSDMDAKFNLAYVKKLLEEEDGGGGGQDQNDQNQDQNQDQQGGENDQGDQNQDQNDKGDQGEQDKNDQGGQDPNDKGKNDQKPEGQQQGQQGMNRTEAEQMLEAIQAQEDKTQEKVEKEKKGAVVGGSRRNW